MNKDNVKRVSAQVFQNLARKVAESAVNAAVFAYVSGKVSKFMDRKDEKNKVRVETDKETKEPTK